MTQTFQLTNCDIPKHRDVQFDKLTPTSKAKSKCKGKGKPKPKRKRKPKPKPKPKPKYKPKTKRKLKPKPNFNPNLLTCGLWRRLGRELVVQASWAAMQHQ